MKCNVITLWGNVTLRLVWVQMMNAVNSTLGLIERTHKLPFAQQAATCMASVCGALKQEEDEQRGETIFLCLSSGPHDKAEVPGVEFITCQKVPAQPKNLHVTAQWGGCENIYDHSFRPNLLHLFGLGWIAGAESHLVHLPKWLKLIMKIFHHIS